MSNAFEITHSARNGSSVTGTIRVARTGKAYAFAIIVETGAVALAPEGFTHRRIPANHLRDVRAFVAQAFKPAPAPVAAEAAPKAKPIVVMPERDRTIYRAFQGRRCLVTAVRRRTLDKGPLWTLATADGVTVGTCEDTARVRLELRYAARAYLAQLAAAEAPQAEPEALAPSRISAAFAKHLSSCKASAAWAEMDSAGRWAVWAKGEASHGSASCVGVFPREPEAQAFADSLRHDDTARAAALDAAETFALAVRYEDKRNQDASEPNYASETDLRACVTAALLAGWQFDREAAAGNDWPWYVTGQSAIDNESAIKRNGEWRFYVETAAEALAEELAPEPDDGCPKSDPDCMGNNGDCHDACEAPQAEPAPVPSMYVRREPDGLWALRQTRFRAQLEAGRDHPHDVCAVARDPQELRSMTAAHWPDADFSGAMVPQLAQQPQARDARHAKGILEPGCIPERKPRNEGRKNSTDPEGAPRRGWFDAKCIDATGAPYLTLGATYRLRLVRNGWFETEAGDRMAQFRFERIKARGAAPQAVQLQQADAGAVRHTPGPWTFIEDGEANRFHVMADGNWLMAFQHNSEQLDAKQRANLQLVTAAPDMVAALESALEAWAFQFDPPEDAAQSDLQISGADFIDWFAQWRTTAVAAVAAAKGQPQK